MINKSLIIFFMATFIFCHINAGGLNLPTSPDDFDRLNLPVGVNKQGLGEPSLTGDYDPDQADDELVGKTYYITAGDKVIVKLPDDKEFSEYEVNFEGYITLPKMGNFKAEGLTIEELEKSIFFELPVYLRKMGEVEVQIKEKMKYIQVLGYVVNPGWYLVPENISVQGVLTVAGSLMDGTVWTKVQIYRKIYGLRTTQTKKINVDMFRFLVSTDQKILPNLRSKDIVIAPMTPRMGNVKRSLAPISVKKEDLETDLDAKIRIFGAVRSPQMLEPIKNSNLLDLIITCGGETGSADLSHIFLIKKLKDGSYRTTVCNLQKYIEDKDFINIPYVGEGEVVYIPVKRPNLILKIWNGGISFLKDIMYYISAITSLIILTNQYNQ